MPVPSFSTQDLGGTTMSAGLLNSHGVLLKVLFGDPGSERIGKTELLGRLWSSIGKWLLVVGGLGTARQ